MAFAQGSNNLLIKDLIDKISEESILEYYTGITQVPCVVNSPFRVDNNPSFGLYYNDYGIHFKDFAKGYNGSLYDLLKEKLNIDSLPLLRDRIVQDFEEIKKLDKYILKKDKRIYNNKDFRQGGKSVKTLSVLNVRKRDWRDYDLEFWKQFGISKEWLEFGCVYPISHIQLGDKTYTSDKYAYCYVEFKDAHPTLKIYQPYSDRLKWLNNHGSSVWDLWQQALNSKSDELIITSSRKDALCLWANTGIPSVSLQAEGYLPKPHVVDILWKKFNTIYCFYDNDYDKDDNYGREYGKKLSELYGFKQIEIPDFYLSKDPSDLYKNYGDVIFKQVLQQILKNK